MRWWLGALSACLCVGGSLRGWAEDVRPLTAVVHVHTGVSDGVWTAKDVAAEAQRCGAEVVLFADSLLERWEFGLPPFRRVIRRVFEESSVLTWGAAPYVESIETLTHDMPKVLCIPGVNVAPFYRWTDIPVLRHGTLEQWHRQLLVFGLHDPRALTEIPAVSNAHGAWWTVLRHPWTLWPVLLIVLGGLGWRNAYPGAWARTRYAVLIGVGLLCLANADLTGTSAFHPYQRDPRGRPYQDVIDYVTRHGGVVLWSHPGLESHGTFHGIPVETPAYTDLLFETRGYLGFGMNYAAYLQFAEPGQGWDQLLLQYCRGTRAQPVWLLGESAFHDASRPLTYVQTVLYATARTEDAVLAAMRGGRMYAQFNPSEHPDLVLSAYTIVDEATQRSAGMGETLDTSGPVRIELAGAHQPEGEPMDVTVIRNGAVVYTTQLADAPFTLQWRDPAPPSTRGYYRVMLRRGTNSRLVTNPTFVQPHVP